MNAITLAEARAAVDTVDEKLEYNFLVDTLDVPERDLVDLFDENTFGIEEDS